MLERFALALPIFGKPEMVKSESYGQWARYSDALELEAENAALKSQLALTEKALELLLDNLFEMDDETCPADTVDSGFDCDINNCGVERPYKKCWKQYYLQQAKIEGEK